MAQRKLLLNMSHLHLLTRILGQAEPVLPIEAPVKNGEQALLSLKNLSLDDAISRIANGTVDFAFKLFIAIVVFYAGKFVIRKIYEFTASVMHRRRLDASLTTFVLSLERMVLFFILIVTVIGILGIETSSFLALFASAGVAMGMALSGTLQNFAGGVLILLLKPYKVGDFIEAGGYTGKVKAIQIFHTVINTVDNKAIIIPNGGLSTGSINNYSLENFRRVDWTIGLSYDTDYAAARDCIMRMLESDSRVLMSHPDDSVPDEPQPQSEEGAAVEDMPARKSWLRRLFGRNKTAAESGSMSLERVLEQKIVAPPFVGLNELAESSINIAVRVWARADDYWPLYFEMNERFFTELPRHGFSFPFPQLDVHLNPQPSSGAE